MSLMSEEEARRKWCPFMHLNAYREEMSENLVRDGKCCATGCAAWVAVPQYRQIKTDPWVLMDYAPHGWEKRIAGRCGLAR